MSEKLHTLYFDTTICALKYIIVGKNTEHTNATGTRAELFRDESDV